MRGLYDKDLQPKQKGVAEQFAGLLSKIRSHKGRPSSIGESTYALRRAIGKFNSTFNGYDQQDAQELLKAVLEGINEDCNRVTKKPQYKELKIESKCSIQQNVIRLEKTMLLIALCFRAMNGSITISLETTA